jgi:hypothetical protein
MEFVQEVWKQIHPFILFLAVIATFGFAMKLFIWITGEND